LASQPTSERTTECNDDPIACLCTIIGFWYQICQRRKERSYGWIIVMRKGQRGRCWQRFRRLFQISTL
jgi:hypothetical protein